MELTSPKLSGSYEIPKMTSLFSFLGVLESCDEALHTVIHLPEFMILWPMEVTFGLGWKFSPVIILKFYRIYFEIRFPMQWYSYIRFVMPAWKLMVHVYRFELSWEMSSKRPCVFKVKGVSVKTPYCTKTRTSSRFAFNRFSRFRIEVHAKQLYCSLLVRFYSGDFLASGAAFKI